MKQLETQIKIIHMLCIRVYLNQGCFGVRREEKEQQLTGMATLPPHVTYVANHEKYRLQALS